VVDLSVFDLEFAIAQETQLVEGFGKTSTDANVGFLEDRVPKLVEGLLQGSRRGQDGLLVETLTAAILKSVRAAAAADVVVVVGGAKIPVVEGEAVGFAAVGAAAAAAVAGAVVVAASKTRW